MAGDGPLPPAPNALPAAPERVSFLQRFENGFAYLAIALVAALPTAEVLIRNVFRTGIPGSGDLLRHLVLWVAFIGGTVTARQKRHLALTAGVALLPQRAQKVTRAVSSGVAVAVSLAFAVASLSFIVIGLAGSPRVIGIPIQVLSAIMPLGFLVIAVRFVMYAGESAWPRAVASIGILLGLILSWDPLVAALEMVLPEAASTLAGALSGPIGAVNNAIHVPLILLLIASSLLGAPVFVLLGGLGYLFILHSGGAPAVVADEAYNMISGPYIGAIPLFTLVGFLLSAGKAGERLVRLFRALFGWLPGGLAAVSILICTFFASFTGASGVTILALGTIMAFILMQSGYDKNFAQGLQTVSGIGTLFPPSLPVIMFGVIAQIGIDSLFLAGILPGALMVIAMWLYGGAYAVRRKIPRNRLDAGEIVKSLGGSITEVLIPVLILALFFGGVATLVETGAITVVYVLLTGLLIHRDLPFKALREAFFRAVPVMGGVLLILAAAKGLSYYVVDAQVPDRLTEWLGAYVHSKYVFLLLLNVFLLVVGCFMDIYSAITVVVPLILPLGRAYGIDPIHLGIIFLANLELGYLTPPVGMNLFLASYLFQRPVVQVYRLVLAPLLVLLVTVLLITYVPWFSTVLPGILGR